MMKVMDIAKYLSKSELEMVLLFCMIMNQSKSRYIADYCISKMKEYSLSHNLLVISYQLYNKVFFVKREYIDKECYFVDYENLSTTTSSYLSSKKNSIIYYVTNNKLKVDTSLIDPSNIIYIETHHSNHKNCADFLLDVSLLNMVEKYQFPNIEILSNDHGFKGIINIINTIYQQRCTQKTRMEIVDVTQIPLHKIIEDTKRWIVNKPSLDLPASKTGLEKVIKEELYGQELDADIVKHAIYEIAREGLLCFYGETIHYQGVRYHGA